MAHANETFVCEKCGLVIRQVASTEEIPEHCGMPMIETLWSHNEMQTCDFAFQRV